MGLFKKFSTGIKKATQRFVKPPKISVPQPIRKVGDFVGVAAEEVVDTAKDAGQAVGDGAGHVWDASKPARDTVGKVLDPVLEGVDHADHFLKTGDFGKQIEKLLEEQDAAKQKLAVETGKFYEASAALVKAQARLMALDRANEKYYAPGSFGPTGVADLRHDVEFDFYADPATRKLEEIGLKPIADGVKLFRQIAYLPPSNFVGRQIELAQVRKELRKSISHFDKAIAERKKSRSSISAAKGSIRRKIKKIEDKFIAADIEISPTSAMELEVQQIEVAANKALAQALLADGLEPEIVTQITGLSEAELASLRVSG